MLATFLLQANPMELIKWGIWIFLGVIIFVAVIVLLNFGVLWIQAASSGAKVSMFNLVGMWFRRVNADVIVNTRIMAVKAGLQLPSDLLEAHYLARGNVPNVVRALIAAKNAGIPLTWQKATAIDLAGRDVLDAVQTSVRTKIIDCPDRRSGKSTIDAVALNGIQLRAKARVTVRTNLDRVVGGATEETIIARVGEGIVSAIGSSVSHKDVLENPNRISQAVLAKGLDSGTAYSILSIDIADVDVGENVGAKLQTDQAEADRRVAQAKAEERRVMAIAQEQEMKARVQENRAKVILAQAEVPKAIAQAFREGHICAVEQAHK